MSVRALLSHRLTSLGWVAAIIVLLPPLFPSAYYYRVGALVLILALAAIGLNLLMGFAGQVSLGHAGFLGIGGYAVAIGPAHLGLPSWLSIFAGAALSGLVAFLVGRPILRLKGHYLAVATLGFGLLVAIVLTNEAAWSGGPDGMSVPRLVLLDWRVRGSDTWYWIAAATFLAGAALALNLIDSPTGRALKAIHDSEVASAVLGVDVARHGDDMTVIWPRRGRDARSWPPVRLRIADLMQVAARVAEQARMLVNGQMTAADFFVRNVVL